MKCLCGKKVATSLFKSGLYDVVKCVSCGQMRIESASWRRAKRTQYYEEEDVKFYIENQDMFRRIFREKLRFIRRFAPRGTMLDIGAGVGLFLDEARKIGYRVIGFEPSKASVIAAKRYFGIKLIPEEFSLKMLERNVSTLDPRVRGDDKKRGGDDKKRGGDDKRGGGYDKGEVDIIVINHVLEHLKNPKEVIQGCSQILKAASGDAAQGVVTQNNRRRYFGTLPMNMGILVLGVPNFGSFMSWIKRGKWQSLIPREHRWQFTLATLDRLVTPHGFRRIGVSYENHNRSMHYWWKRPIYWVLDHIAVLTGHAEAMLVMYEKQRDENNKVTK